MQTRVSQSKPPVAPVLRRSKGAPRIEQVERLR
jgi:hypothetical protein